MDILDLRTGKARGLSSSPNIFNGCINVPVQGVYAKPCAVQYPHPPPASAYVELIVSTDLIFFSRWSGRQAKRPQPCRSPAPYQAPHGIIVLRVAEREALRAIPVTNIISLPVLYGTGCLPLDSLRGCGRASGSFPCDIFVYGSRTRTGIEVSV